MRLEIAHVTCLPLSGFADLLADSLDDGHRMLERLEQDWASGANRFDRAGECLLAASRGDALAGIGGRNVDPYLGDPRAGRIRHLYVARDARRLGVGRRIMEALTTGAALHFDRLTLRTHNPGAARFYEALGFSRDDAHPDVTHLRRL